MQRLKDAEAGVAALPSNAWDSSRSPENSTAIGPFASALQQLGTDRAFAGGSAGAVAAFDAQSRASGPRREENAAEAGLVDEASVEDAVQAIVAQARSRRVVLLNEGHNMSMHRAFSQRVARNCARSAIPASPARPSNPTAFRAGEPADAVPTDVVLVDAGKPAPKLMLPKGEYRFTVED